MKCAICGVELSKAVMKIHEPICKATLKPNNYKKMNYNELRTEAKLNNIDLGKAPKKADLIVALEHLGVIE